MLFVAFMVIVKDNACLCYGGWEGAGCTRSSTSKFVGSYKLQESCSTGNFTNNVTITVVDTTNQVILNRLYDNTDRINAFAIRNNDSDTTALVLRIAGDNGVSNANRYEYLGNGNYDMLTKKIIGRYRVTQTLTGLYQDCAFTFTRQ